MDKLKIEPIDINDVFKYDKDRYNSNNHGDQKFHPGQNGEFLFIKIK